MDLSFNTKILDKIISRKEQDKNLKGGNTIKEETTIEDSKKNIEDIRTAVLDAVREESCKRNRIHTLIEAIEKCKIKLLDENCVKFYLLSLQDTTNSISNSRIKDLNFELTAHAPTIVKTVEEKFNLYCWVEGRSDLFKKKEKFEETRKSRTINSSQVLTGNIKDKKGDEIELLIKKVSELFPGSKVIEEKKETTSKKAERKSMFKEPSQEVITKIKAREKEMYEKGWLPEQIWNCDAYWYDKAGLAALMNKDEEIGTITSESIELISYQNNERIVQFFAKRKNSKQSETNNNSQSIKKDK